MKKYLSRFSRVAFTASVISIIIYVMSIVSTEVADFMNSTVSVAVRFFLSLLSSPFPFSLFELLIILCPIILVLVIILALRGANDRTEMIRGTVTFVAVLSLIFTSYIFTLGVGYRTTRLADRIDLETDSDISREELYDTVLRVVEGVNTEARLLDTDGRTYMPYTKDEMSKKLVRAYDLMNREYSLVTNFTSRVKPVRFSTVMSDLGITGIYSFFTGESNINVEYPDYTLPFTAAHELAHQRGIAREDEANFVAFLVCIYSDDAYIRYSGYLNMYEYLASALYRADPDLYGETLELLPPSAIADIRASDEVYLKHKDSPLGRINERLNDAYLKANGTEGIVSYGYVTRLAIAYYQKQNNG